MKIKSVSKVLIYSLLVSLQALYLAINSVQQAKAQNLPTFLAPPYYGTKFVRSNFDHEYPTYGGSPNNNNGTFSKYDGEYWSSGTGIGNCTNGVNCYDGHDGLDIAMDGGNGGYEHVLAAASGTVTKAGWYDNSCHDCGYGLEVEIQHSINGNTYRTRYGHLSSISVGNGSSVQVGTIIGTSGSTGSSTGTHLHFGIKKYINGTWRPIDTMGWSGASGDPWAGYPTGATSWCLWSYGQFANFCDPNQQSSPSLEPGNGREILIDDDFIGFTKGSGGLWNNPCIGPCPGWIDTGAGEGNHSYITYSDGVETPNHWAKWQPQGLTGRSVIYEVFVKNPSVPGYDNNTFTWSARHIVVDAAGTSYVTNVDEYTNNYSYNPHDKWISLGVYFMNNVSYIYTTDATGELLNTHCPNSPNDWCRMNIDAIKLVEIGDTNIPDVKATNSGWATRIRLQNNNGSYSRTKISYFNSDGVYVGGSWVGIPPHGVAVYQPIGISSPVSAVVNASVFTSIIVTQDQESPLVLESYTGLYSPTTEVFVPILQRGNNSNYSKLYIQNAGINENGVMVEFKPIVGVTCGGYYAIPPYSFISIGVLCNGDPSGKWIGSARIYSYDFPDIPFAVTSTQYHINSLSQVDALMETESVGDGAPNVYAPLIQNYNSNYWSGISIQNTDTSMNNLLVNFYPQNQSTPCKTFTHYNVSPFYSVIDFSPGTQYCPTIISGILSGSNNKHVAAIINQVATGTLNYADYSAIAAPGKTVSLPLWYNQWNGWFSSVIVSNPSATYNVAISFFLYNEDGTPALSAPVVRTIGPYQMSVFWLYPQNQSFVGSAVLTADRPIAAIENHLLDVHYGDPVMSNTAIHR